MAFLSPGFDAGFDAGLSSMDDSGKNGVAHDDSHFFDDSLTHSNLNAPLTSFWDACIDTSYLDYAPPTWAEQDVVSTDPVFAAASAPVPTLGPSPFVLDMSEGPMLSVAHKAIEDRQGQAGSNVRLDR